MGVEKEATRAENSSRHHSTAAAAAHPIEIYRPPPLRRLQQSAGGSLDEQLPSNSSPPNVAATKQPSPSSSLTKTPSITRERRPDRAVYIPRARRSQTTPPPAAKGSTTPPPPKSVSAQPVILPPPSPQQQQQQPPAASTGNMSSKERRKKNGAAKIEVVGKLERRASKDDADKAAEDELRKASQEMNRKSRRIIKQTFNSNVLEIQEPPEKDKEKEKETNKAVNPEEDDWDAMFDDNGECLDPKLMSELTAAVGKVTIEKPKIDYKIFQEKQAILLGEEFPHVLEVSNFPVEFKTQDLMMIFSPYKASGFDIKWVDDTHALAVFSNSKIAAEVLSMPHPFVKLKPLAEATAESRAKAKKSSASLLPYKQRPETCAALARRLVTGALGVRMKADHDRDENERKILREAKERKLLAAKQRDEFWES